MNLYDEIARVAYELWEKKGSGHGTDEENWYEAEILVRARYGQSQAAGETVKKTVKPKRAAAKKTPEKSKRGKA